MLQVPPRLEYYSLTLQKISYEHCFILHSHVLSPTTWHHQNRKDDYTGHPYYSQNFIDILKSGYNTKCMDMNKCILLSSCSKLLLHCYKKHVSVSCEHTLVASSKYKWDSVNEDKEKLKPYKLNMNYGVNWKILILLLHSDLWRLLDVLVELLLQEINFHPFTPDRVNAYGYIYNCHLLFFVLWMVLFWYEMLPLASY